MRFIGVKNYIESLDCTIFKHKMKVCRTKYELLTDLWNKYLLCNAFV